MGVNAQSRVFFAATNRTGKESTLKKVSTLLGKVCPGGTVLDGALAAVKIHFGEKGNTAFVRPAYAGQVVSFLKERGARPFLTDSNTLYVGSRGDSVSHVLTAAGNGFDLGTVGAPVLIAGGLRGTRGVKVPVQGSHFSEVEIAPEILDADLIVGLSHFKGHEMSGFGGTIKNFGMGAATRGGKLSMHSRVAPHVADGVCTGCRLCDRWCAHGAIGYREGRAVIDRERCVGCGACLAICPVKAIRITWNEQVPDMQEKLAEYAWGALKDHLPGRAFFLNFIMQVSPLCDCYPFTGAPIVPDVGVLASVDPVALDQASVDLVNAQRGLEGSALPGSALPPGEDKFRGVHPEVDWSVQLEHAQALGLGLRSYLLSEV